MGVPPQYSGPRISEKVDPEVRRHLQIIYQKLGNHLQGITLLKQQVDAESTKFTSSSGEIVSVGGGGTGRQSIPQFAVVLGNNSGPLLFTNPVMAGFVLTDSGPGMSPSFEALSAYPYTYAGLTSAFPSPGIGQIAVITDATVNTWGSLITTGGGALKVLVWCDSGASWSVIGK